MFRREQMEYLLNTANGIGPICIPTYKRWSREDNKALSFLELCQPDIRDNIHIFVRPEQAQAYHESFPWVHIVVLPARIQGLASTREYICWYVLNVLHEPIFMDMDDDVTEVLYMWYDEIKQFSHYSRKFEQRHSETIRLGFNLAQYVFNKAPKTIHSQTRKLSTHGKYQSRSHSPTVYVCECPAIGRDGDTQEFHV